MKNYCTTLASSVLGRDITIRFIVPEGDNLQCLFLLHGYNGNQDQWLNESSIAHLSEEYKLVVVSPGCGNGYYENTQEDIPCFLGEELVAFARENLPISNSKDDTFIAGVSMGGFGALLVAAKYCNVFGKVASLSGAFIIHDVVIGNPGVLGNAEVNYLRSVFGDFSTLEGSSRDPVAETIRASKLEEVPAIFLLCGSGDVLYQANLKAARELASSGVSVTWYGGVGNHQWTFWNDMLSYVVRWLVDGYFPQRMDDSENRLSPSL